MTDDRRKKPTDESPGGREISRRDLLRTAGAAGAAAMIPVSADATTSPEITGRALPTATAGAASRAPMINLTAAEAELLSAMVDRLIPTDEMGPGALDCGALTFIDRALSESASNSVDAYRAGLAALDTYSRYTRRAPFLELSDLDKDSVLLDLQTGGATGAGVGFVGSSGGFFNMVKSHTWQAMFGDPQYGGNKDFAGWDLIRYPGVRMRVTEDEQRRLEADELPDARQSAYDIATFQTGRDD